MAQVVVQQLDGRQVEVAGIDPGASMQAVDNPQLEAAAHVFEKLMRVIANSEDRRLRITK